MLGPEPRYTFKRKPWTLFDRIAVTCLYAAIVFVPGFVLWARTHSRHVGGGSLFSFESLLWVTGIVAVVAFLLTFTDDLER
jgi:hypothetical protein